MLLSPVVVTVLLSAVLIGCGSDKSDDDAKGNGKAEKPGTNKRTNDHGKKLEGTWVGKYDNGHALTMTFGAKGLFTMHEHTDGGPFNVYSVDWNHSPAHIDLHRPFWGHIESILQVTEDGNLLFEMGIHERPGKFSDKAWKLTRATNGQEAFDALRAVEQAFNTAPKGQEAAITALTKMRVAVGFTREGTLWVSKTPYPTVIDDTVFVHVKELTNLQTLRLDSTNVTDAGLQHLKGLTNLDELSLLGTPGVSEEGARKLQEALPNCKILKESLLKN